MEEFLTASVAALLAALALPGVGLPAIFLVSVISATLLPMGSEPAVFAYVKLAADMFWPAVVVATIGNTLGGVISYFMGCGASNVFDFWRRRPQRADGHQSHSGMPEATTLVDATPSDTPLAKSAEPGVNGRGQRWHRYAVIWLQRLGPRALLFSWVPAVGDPLCAVAGWMRFPFWSTVAYMAIGKFARYVIMTAALLWVFPNT